MTKHLPYSILFKIIYLLHQYIQDRKIFADGKYPKYS